MIDDPNKKPEELPEATGHLFYQEPDDVILPVEEPDETVPTEARYSCTSKQINRPQRVRADKVRAGAHVETRPYSRPMTHYF